MPLDATQLAARLRFDFRAGDVGDTDTEFTARLVAVVSDAILRQTATPTATDTQLEYGARWVLLGAQVRQILRDMDRVRIQDEGELGRDIAPRLATLRLELQSARLLSGLDVSTVTLRSKTVVARVQAEF